DHLGGAPDVLRDFRVGTFADNGRDEDKREVALVGESARAHGVRHRVVNPSNAAAPLDGDGAISIDAIVPKSWPSACATDANDCSIGLRVAWCGSSVLFTGDAGSDEEAAFAAPQSTLLQVGHHGSETSTSRAFLAHVEPSYAVISAGRRGE